jgi:hypothetical protein
VSRFGEHCQQPSASGGSHGLCVRLCAWEDGGSEVGCVEKEREEKERQENERDKRREEKKREGGREGGRERERKKRGEGAGERERERERERICDMGERKTERMCVYLTS